MYICGSDEHGVPITIKAQKEGVQPQDIVDRYHGIIKNAYRSGEFNHAEFIVCPITFGYGISDFGLSPPEGIEAAYVLAKSRWKDKVGEGQTARQVEGRWQTPERVFIPGRKNPVVLKPGTGELLLLQRIRDEAHRFAISYHRELRRKRIQESALDEIPGIGKKTKERLLNHFGSFARLRKASLEELLSAPGVGPKTAQIIFNAISSRYE